MYDSSLSIWDNIEVLFSNKFGRKPEEVRISIDEMFGKEPYRNFLERSNKK
jgi:hypothetical protein